MPTTSAFSLTFAGIPFTGDRAHIVSLNDVPEHSILLDKQLPELSLYEQVQKNIPLEWMRDFTPCPDYSHRLFGIARQQEPSIPLIDIGRWYYPTGASRWSVFRGLMTSAMVAALRTATANFTATKPFVLQAAPNDPVQRLTSAYSITTNMYALPPRPLGENGGTFPGLYLVTLVDERWYFQGTTVTLHPSATTTWEDLLEEIADALDISIECSTISSNYAQPEPDSPFWANRQDAAVLLDAIAANIGRVCVREYDGTYTLLTWAETQTRIQTNRGTAAQVVRMAGGDLFSTSTLLPVGNQTTARNAVVPQQVNVTFPKYITGNDPVPHFYNPRTSGQQPTAWDEVSYGAVHTHVVPLASGGANVSGLTGTSEETLRTTAKALYETEASASGLPTNDASTGLLAASLATAYYDSLVVPSLDEVYPGTFAWVPEGGHDLLFTYSERLEQASLRVTRASWNSQPNDFQHSTPGVSYVAGVGGRRVPQTWSDGSTTQYGVNLVRIGGGLTLTVSGTTGGINEVLLTAPSMSGGVFASGSNVTFDNVIINYLDSVVNISSGSTLNVYASGQVNIQSGGVLNFGGNSQINILASGAVYISSGQTLTISGGQTLTVYTPLEVCGYQFWCCKAISTSGIAAIDNWDLPASGGAATMYSVTAASGVTSVYGIIPAQSGKGQIIGLVNQNSGAELRLFHDHANASGFNEVLLPSQYSGGTLGLFEGDAALLWWDDCGAEKWRVLNTSTARSGSVVTSYSSGQSIYIASGNTFYLASGATVNLNAQIFNNAWFNGGYRTYFFSGNTTLGSGVPVFCASGSSVQGSYSVRVRNDPLTVFTAFDIYANTYSHYGYSGQETISLNTSGSIHSAFIEGLFSGGVGPPFKTFNLTLASQTSGAGVDYDGVVTVAVDSMPSTNTSGLLSVGPIV